MYNIMCVEYSYIYTHIYIVEHLTVPESKKVTKKWQRDTGAN